MLEVMPKTTSELLDLLDLTETSPDVFSGSQPDTIMQRTYGGQVMAQAIVAAYKTLPEDRRMHSMHAFFLRPGNAHVPITYKASRLRDGRTFSTRRVDASQKKDIFGMSASFHHMEDSRLNHQDELPSPTPPPEKCPRLVDFMNAAYGEHPMWHEWDALDVRFAGDSAGNGSPKLPKIPVHSHKSHMRVWIKTQEKLPDDYAIHQAILAYASDLTLLSVTTVPHSVAFMSTKIQTASIDHAMWFHRQGRADEWLLYDMISPSASHALGYGTGRLFQDGKLIASCAQEGLVREVENRPILS